MMRVLAFLMTVLALPLAAGELVVRPVAVTEWKSVYATVEARRTVPARARIGGTVGALAVTEGMTVSAKETIGKVEDQKLDFQLAALAAQITSAEAQLQNARAELARGEALTGRGVSTAQRVDALRTQVDIADGQLLALRAERDRTLQTRAEGEVLAPSEGVVLSVPVSTGEVIQPGEPVAIIAADGFFLRLQVPERYASGFSEGASIRVGEGADARTGTLAKVYPLIEGGRVQADIDVDGIDPRFVGLRVAVRLPVGQRDAIAVPAEAITHRNGLDFVAIQSGGSITERVVLPGATVEAEGGEQIEIVSGLNPGETVVIGND